MHHKLYFSLKYTLPVLLKCYYAQTRFFSKGRKMCQNTKKNTGTNSTSFFVLCNFICVFALNEIEVKAVFVNVSLNVLVKPDIPKSTDLILEIISNSIIWSFSHLNCLVRYRVPCLSPHLVSLKLLRKALPQSKTIDWSNILKRTTLYFKECHYIRTYCFH